ncbi:hypothetical protein [Nocardia sp. NPDC058705]|uniref:hypothetical protein n=1 Tax=Nocardia sp. NPDC058705 TaxID=3346609 RepID=UPI0036A9302E
MSVRVGAGVRALDEAVTCAKRVFDVNLVLGVLDVGKFAMIDHSGICGITDSRRCIRAGDVIADLAKIVRAQELSGRSGEQAYVVAERVGDAGRPTGIQVCVGGRGIIGEFHVDQETIVTEQRAAVVERRIDGRLDVLHCLTQVVR